MQTIDARGRSCPEPVMMTRAALKADASGAVVRVDNPCAAENITRYAAHEGYQTAREDAANGETTLTITKP